MWFNAKRKDVKNMGHTPFGYKIKNGIAVIDEEEANQLREIYSLYLSGLSFNAIARKLEIKIFHTGIKRMLLNKKYLGDDYYPPIIDKETFDKVPLEINTRAESLGRLNRGSKIKKVVIPSVFTVIPIEEYFDNPFIQAEYIYTLIESEVS